MLSDIKWIAQYEAIKPLTDRWIAVGETHHLPAHTLIVIMDGTAVWSMNGHKTNVTFGQLIAVEKDSIITVVDGENRDLAGWIIHFHICHLNQDDQGAIESDSRWLTSYANSYHKVNLTEVALTSLGHKLSKQIQSDASQNWNATWSARQQLIYELLNYLYSEQIEELQTMEQALRRTTEYMHKHYGGMVTRAQLAQVAQMSPWHYTRKFTAHYGQSPLDYLAHFRIYRALEELILTSEKSQHIAKKVGYEDPHYFSRRFKQLTGVSPRNYVLTLSKRKILCLSPLCAVALIDIGIIPHAVVVTSVLVPQHQLDLFIEHHVLMLEVSQYEVEIDSIREVKPEIIIGTLCAEETVRKLRMFAPVITGLSTEPERLLHQLGTLFHREEQAKQLQMQMEAEIETARTELQSLIQSGVTVMVLRVEPFGYRFLGKYSNGVSNLFYQQLGLRIPQSLESGEAWFNPCSVEQLLQANPDYLFVEKRVMQHFSVEESMQKLVESDVWSKLDAVRNKHVIYVDTSVWIDGCSFNGQKIILDQIKNGMMDSKKVQAQ